MRASVPSATPVPPLGARGSASSRSPDSARASAERAARPATERGPSVLGLLHLAATTLGPPGPGRTAPRSMIARRGGTGDAVSRAVASDDCQYPYVPISGHSRCFHFRSQCPRFRSPPCPHFRSETGHSDRGPPRPPIGQWMTVPSLHPRPDGRSSAVPPRRRPGLRSPASIAPLRLIWRADFGPRGNPGSWPGPPVCT
jgi:hypothetical protein